MQIQKLTPDEVTDFRHLVEIFKDVFENEEHIADDVHLHTLLLNPDFRVFVVRIEEGVVGGLTMYVLHRYLGTKPIAYIYDVGISPMFQGKGVGKALIAYVCQYCKENGFVDAYVEAEKNDIEAVNFYRKTNYTRELYAIHFTYTFDGENEKSRKN